MPVSWIDPPLWIIRNINFHSRTCKMHLENELGDAFRISPNQENIFATAKRRFVLVISPDIDIRNLEDVLVAPIYSIKNMKPDQKKDYENNPSLFYLHPDPSFKEIKESLISFNKISPVKKQFLKSTEKLPFSFQPNVFNAILNKIADFITINK